MWLRLPGKVPQSPYVGGRDPLLLQPCSMWSTRSTSSLNLSSLPLILRSFRPGPDLGCKGRLSSKNTSLWRTQPPTEREATKQGRKMISTLHPIACRAVTLLNDHSLGTSSASKKWHLLLVTCLMRPKHCSPHPKGRAKDAARDSIIFPCSAHTVLFKRLMRHIFSIKKLFQKLLLPISCTVHLAASSALILVGGFSKMIYGYLFPREAFVHWWTEYWWC